MTQTAKQKILEFIESLPDELSEEEITYQLYVREEIHKAQDQIQQKQVYTQDQVEEMFQKWLT